MDGRDRGSDFGAMKRRHEYFLLLSGFCPPAPRADGLRLRAYQAEDLQNLAALMLEAYRGTVDSEGEALEDAIREVEGWLAGSHGGPALPEVSRLAFDDAQLVGACLAAEWPWLQMPGINQVMTHPEWKNRGVGRQLLTEVLQALSAAGYEEVRSVITEGNIPSERLFARLGFRNVVTAAEVLLRPATPDDASGVADVYLASRRVLLPFAPLAHPPDEVRKWIAEVLLPAGGVTVATVQKEIVGMMALSRRDEADWITHLYLHPKATGHGIGSRLLARALEELGPRIRLYTFQENMPARRFYERHGFQAIAFGDGSGNEERCPDVLYELNRTPE
jgi:GNAT superfamily N-acetyltransferase